MRSVRSSWRTGHSCRGCRGLEKVPRALDEPLSERRRELARVRGALAGDIRDVEPELRGSVRGQRAHRAAAAREDLADGRLVGPRLRPARTRRPARRVAHEREQAPAERGLDDVLDELDWVQLSLHAGQRAPARELTARVTYAMRHPAVRCLSHPTGRLIGHRPENALDLETTIETALETGVALEVNGLPDRLDLRDEYVRVALQAGASIVCSTDAHSTRGLANMPLAVHTARRGHATTNDVLNTRPCDGLRRGGDRRD